MWALQHNLWWGGAPGSIVSNAKNIVVHTFSFVTHALSLRDLVIIFVAYDDVHFVHSEKRSTVTDGRVYRVTDGWSRKCRKKLQCWNLIDQYYSNQPVYVIIRWKYQWNDIIKVPLHFIVSFESEYIQLVSNVVPNVLLLTYWAYTNQHDPMQFKGAFNVILICSREYKTCAPKCDFNNKLSKTT